MLPALLLVAAVELDPDVLVEPEVDEFCTPAVSVAPDVVLDDAPEVVPDVVFDDAPEVVPDVVPTDDALFAVLDGSVETEGT